MSLALVQKGVTPIKISPAIALLCPPALAAPGEMLQTAEGLCEFTGQRRSWLQAQESCDHRFGHLALGPLDRALTSHLPSSVWVGQREASLRSQPQRREYGLRIWCKQGGGEDSVWTSRDGGWVSLRQQFRLSWSKQCMPVLEVGLTLGRGPGTPTSFSFRLKEPQIPLRAPRLCH